MSLFKFIFYYVFIADFEAASWVAARRIFGAEVEMRGCLFHWSQAVYRKIQELHLQKAFSTNRGIHSYCKTVMALPYLPAEWIEPVFDQLQRAAPTEALKNLTTYIHQQWISNKTFPIHSWSAFKRPFRTNNDVEGWHHKLNFSAHSAGLNLYKLVHILHLEATDVEYACRFVSERLMLRCQRKRYVRLHGRINNLWEQFGLGELSAKQLLKSCSHLVKWSPEGNL